MTLPTPPPARTRTPKKMFVTAERRDFDPDVRLRAWRALGAAPPAGAKR